MSKYNLSDLVTEITGTGRIGTYIDSYRGLIDKIEDIKSKGIAVKELGMSGDGKVPFEFEIYPGDKDEAFSVYPYKFDPSESDPMEIHRFSIGGKPVAIRVAKELLGQEAMSNAEVRDGLQGLKDAGDDISDFSDLQEGEDKKDLINAMRFHLLQYQKGNIDKDDVIQAMEELAFGRVKAPGMDESIEENALGFSDIEKLGSKAASDIDISVRRDPNYTFGKRPGDDDRLRYMYAKKLGYVEESIEENLVDEDDVRYFDIHFGDKYSEDFIVDYIKSGNFEAALDEHPLEDEHKDFWAYELEQFDAERDDVSLQEHFARFMKDYQ